MPMGRGSDTRIYAPRSESDHMYSANEGDDKYNPVDPKFKDAEKERQQAKEEDQKKLRTKIKHIKVRRNHGVGTSPTDFENKEPGQDDASQRLDIDDEISRQTGAAGARGAMLDMATQAKTGTGSSMGQLMTGEPMDIAFRLLKADLEELIAERDLLRENGLIAESKEFDKVIQSMMKPEQVQEQITSQYGVPAAQQLLEHHGETDEDEIRGLGELLFEEGRQSPDYQDMRQNREEYPQDLRQNFMGNMSRLSSAKPRIDEAAQRGQMDLANLRERDPTGFFADRDSQDIVEAGEPMDLAFRLLKKDTDKTMASRRRREKRREFRPSTGQFKKPPGGQNPNRATLSRFRARMRGIKGGKKTGLMKPHLAVEMSHRGIATKQPMSKDPAKYRSYMGQQEAKKILGNIRNVWSPHSRYAERSTRAGPTGGGQLTGLMPGQSGQMRQPSLKRMGMPRIRKPPMPRTPPPMGMPPMGDVGVSSSVPGLPSVPDPSQVAMSEDNITNSDLLKMNYSDLTEIRMLLRRIARAKEVEAKESKKKGGIEKPTMSELPNHPAGVSSENDELDPDGPTENTETNANRLGLDPAGYLTSRGGHMG